MCGSRVIVCHSCSLGLVKKSSKLLFWPTVRNLLKFIFSRTVQTISSTFTGSLSSFYTGCYKFANESRNHRNLGRKLKEKIVQKLTLWGSLRNRVQKWPKGLAGYYNKTFLRYNPKIKHLIIINNLTVYSNVFGGQNWRKLS